MFFLRINKLIINKLTNILCRTAVLENLPRCVVVSPVVTVLTPVFTVHMVQFSHQYLQCTWCSFHTSIYSAHGAVFTPIFTVHMVQFSHISRHIRPQNGLTGKINLAQVFFYLVYF